MNSTLNPFISSFGFVLEKPPLLLFSPLYRAIANRFMHAFLFTFRRCSVEWFIVRYHLRRVFCPLNPASSNLSMAASAIDFWSSPMSLLRAAFCTNITLNSHLFSRCCLCRIHKRLQAKSVRLHYRF